jgi:hypothetical protein
MEGRSGGGNLCGHMMRAFVIRQLAYDSFARLETAIHTSLYVNFTTTPAARPGPDDVLPPAAFAPRLSFVRSAQ